MRWSCKHNYRFRRSYDWSIEVRFYDRAFGRCLCQIPNCSVDNAYAAVQRALRGHSRLLPVELLFQRADEALDAAVLPRRCLLGAAMTDAEEEGREPEDPRSEHCFVVGPDDARLAVALDRLDKLKHQRLGGLRVDRLEAKRGAARVLDDAEHELGSSVHVVLPVRSSPHTRFFGSSRGLAFLIFRLSTKIACLCSRMSSETKVSPALIAMVA